jgi:hypothetical protein
LWPWPDRRQPGEHMVVPVGFGGHGDRRWGARATF